MKPTLGSLDITQVIEGKSYRAFEELMSPFEGFQGINLQIYAVLLAARFILFVLALFVDLDYEHDSIGNDHSYQASYLITKFSFC